MRSNASQRQPVAPADLPIALPDRFLRHALGAVRAYCARDGEELLRQVDGALAALQPIRPRGDAVEG